MKDHSLRNERHNLGCLSISTEQLIDLIKRGNFQKLSLSNNNKELEGIDEINDHRALCAGNPTLIADGVYVSFGVRNTSVSHIALTHTNERDNRKDIDHVISELKAHKTAGDYFIDYINKTSFVLFLAAVIIQISILYKTNGLLNIDAVDRVLGTLWIGCIGLLVLVFLFDTFILKLRMSIYYAPKIGFIRRSMPQIFLGIVSTILALIVGYMFTEAIG